MNRRIQLSLCILVKDDGLHPCYFGVCRPSSSFFQREADWDRFIAAIGSCRTQDGATDISFRHDEHLSEIFAHD